MYLEVATTNGVRVVEIAGDRITIGRGPDNTLQIADEMTLSRSHAVIERHESGWFVSDAGSRNGTRLNGESVSGPRAVGEGDVIEAGTVVLTLREGQNLEMTWPVEQAEASRPASLTEREREVVRLVAQGLRDREIAESLTISVKTVRSHLDRIGEKSGCRRRPDMTRLAIELKLL
jgi:DNA-binding CsgD family transcriptional regulator